MNTAFWAGIGVGAMATLVVIVAGIGVAAFIFL